MNGLYSIFALKTSGKYYNTKRWEEGELIYMADQNHQRSMILVNHSMNFKNI